MLTYRADGGMSVRPLTGVPELDDLRAAVDGDDLEHVPGFNSILHGGKSYHCAAFCGEHGKLRNMPINKRATILWERALHRSGHGLMRDGRVIDVLVGSVCVVFGDDELMEAL
jgi:hypothetical protein